MSCKHDWIGKWCWISLLFVLTVKEKGESKPRQHTIDLSQMAVPIQLAQEKKPSPESPKPSTSEAEPTAEYIAGGSPLHHASFSTLQFLFLVPVMISVEWNTVQTKTSQWAACETWFSFLGHLVTEAEVCVWNPLLLLIPHHLTEWLISLQEKPPEWECPRRMKRWLCPPVSSWGSHIKQAQLLW